MCQALRGPILYSFLDLDSLKRPQSFEDAVKNGEFKCNWVEESYPTGALDPPVGVVAAPTGSFGILVCKVAAGATLVHQQGDGKMKAFYLCGFALGGMHAFIVNQFYVSANHGLLLEYQHPLVCVYRRLCNSGNSVAIFISCHSPQDSCFGRNEVRDF